MQRAAVHILVNATCCAKVKHGVDGGPEGDRRRSCDGGGSSPSDSGCEERSDEVWEGREASVPEEAQSRSAAAGASRAKAR